MRGLEESANKKLNKHSSSLDNTDWIAYHVKLHKDASLNAAKEAGRISVQSGRTNGVVLAEKCIKGQKPPLTKAQARLKKSTNMIKEKCKNGNNTERLNNIPDRRRTAMGSGTPKPTSLIHQKK